ncbi:hypothetical protein FS749_009358 [Ceratobasidium sp. UAMH 11750]|nr:hypothetical protein FS749_009358 [Ceratobasidium sp. UAMH 11750]
MLTAGAIIGIIVGSVFGTALMFILAAVVLWKCLGLGRYRQKPADDIRVGQGMGYLDGEYVYVQPVNPAHGPAGNLGVGVGRRFTSRRDPRGLRPRADVDLDASDISGSRHPSDYEDDTSRPLRHYTRSPSYLGDSNSLAFVEPPSPFSPARHASMDGRYRGYHPGTSPRSVHRPSLDDRREESYRHDDYYRPSREYEYRASGDRRREYDERERQENYNRSLARLSQHRPSGDRFSGRGSADRYRSSRDRPISGQVSNRRPVSGQFSYHRTSAERKRDHRVSARSGLRPASFESVRRSVDREVGRFVRADDRRPSLDGARFGRDGRFSRDGGRSARQSRDEGRYRKASLSEGEEDLADLGREADESIEGGPRTTSSDHGQRREHLRRRSQSVRTSYDPGHDLGLGLETRENDLAHPSANLPAQPPAGSAPTTHKDTTSNSATGPVAGPSKVRTLRVANGAPELDPLNLGEVSRSTSVLREPGLLARARTLLLTSTPKSSRPSSSASSSHPPSSQPSGSQGAAPPSAWQRLRQIPAALSSPGLPRSSGGSESDRTSAYHTAQGHSTPLGTGMSGTGTPVTEFGNRTIRAGSALGQVQLGGSRESYHQETDAGVQLVVEHGAVASSEEGHSEPPAYAARRESAGSQPAVQPQAQPNTSSHGHSELVSHVEFPESSRARRANRVSTLTRDTDWDSTVSSGVLQTWTPARRSTGFVGTGRVLGEAHAQIPVVNETATEQEPRTSGATSREDALSGSIVNASSTAVSTFFEPEENKPEPVAPDVLSSEGSRETQHPRSRW